MDVKERILKGADDAFMRYGIKSMTMDELSKNLGISKKTIYEHFDNKNDLVLSVIENHMIYEKKMMEEMRESSRDSIEEMVKVSKYIKASMSEINPSVILDLQKFYPKAWAYFQDHKDECITDCIKTNLIQGINEENYRKEINPDILSRLRVEQVQLGFDPSIFPRSEFSPFDVQIELMNHFFMGVVTPKGLELFNKYLNESV